MDSRLSADAATCTLTVCGQPVLLHLFAMRGKAGEILRRVVALTAFKAITLAFRLNARHLHVTSDLADLPAHSERLAPVPAVAGRAIGIDSNSDRIGLSFVEVVREAGAPDLRTAQLLDHRLIRLAVSRVAGQAMGLARA
ncbi:hypothetical protein MFUR16E_17025 [Methylobacterium fujisawaense]|uniref:hypothetical protein n=1 Tax=Methylobacterium fujisawaense TaxID=107400 RepID=UPI002F2F2B7D